MSIMTGRTGWFGVIGAPADVGHVGCGAAAGPGALRRQGLVARLATHGLVADMGDIAGPFYMGGRDATGCKAVTETAAWCAALRDRVGRVLACGGLPILIGGDHSLALGSAAAAAAHARARGQALHVFWFDAHPDFNTPETSPSGNTHGLPAATLCGLGHPALLGVGAFTPLLDPGHLTQFGIRDVDAGERANLDAAGVRYHEMPAVRARGLVPLVDEALARLRAEGGGHLHVSFDLDMLDPAVAPGVGTPVPGGVGLEEAEAALALLGGSGLVGSLDLVEYAPRHDRDDRTGALAERLLTRFVAAAAPAALPSTPVAA